MAFYWTTIHEADPRCRCPHCDLATLVTRKLKEDRPYDQMEPFIVDLAGAARERTGPQVGGMVNIMDLLVMVDQDGSRFQCLEPQTMLLAAPAKVQMVWGQRGVVSMR